MACPQTKNSPDRERAKQVLREIIRLSGGTVAGKTRLFKVFYLAHLYYAREEPDYLSDWPVVRMPNGPGIHDAESLVEELVREGSIQVCQVQVGPYVQVEYRSLREEPPSCLPRGAEAAIQEAVEFVRGRSAAELSELTHEFSRSWQDAQDGDELNIYLDLLTDDEYARARRRLDELASDLQEAWK